MRADNQDPALVLSVNKSEADSDHTTILKARPKTDNTIQFVNEYVMVPLNPTDEQKKAAHDWSYAKYGKPVGDEGTVGCYKSMVSAFWFPEHRLSRSVADLKAALSDKTEPFRAYHGEVKGLVDYYEALLVAKAQDFNWINNYASDSDELEAAIEWLNTQELKINVGPIQQDDVDEYIESTAGWLLRLVKTLVNTKSAKADYQNALIDSYNQGVRNCIAKVHDKGVEYDHEHGSTDPETGTREYSRDGHEFMNTIDEVEGDLRDLLINPNGFPVVEIEIVRKPGRDIPKDVEEKIVTYVREGMDKHLGRKFNKERSAELMTHLVKEAMVKYGLNPEYDIRIKI